MTEDAAALAAALRAIATPGCEASRWHGEEPPVDDRCLDYEYVEEEPTGDPDVDRCGPCRARAALEVSGAVAPSTPVRDDADGAGADVGQPAPDALAAARNRVIVAIAGVLRNQRADMRSEARAALAPVLADAALAALPVHPPAPPEPLCGHREPHEPHPFSTRSEMYPETCEGWTA